MKEKLVKDAMTPLHFVYKLSMDTVLDEDMIDLVSCAVVNVHL